MEIHSGLWLNMSELEYSGTPALAWPAAVPSEDEPPSVMVFYE